MTASTSGCTRAWGSCRTYTTKRRLVRNCRATGPSATCVTPPRGVSVRKNAQPLVVRVCGIEIALAHNGNLTNASELRGELESEGAIFQTSSDSEIFVHLIARSLAKKKDLEEAILSACDRVRGAYSLIILSEGRIIALRDAHGFHPLAMGKVDDAYVFASETCAFDLLEAEYLREVLPAKWLSSTATRSSAARSTMLARCLSASAFLSWSILPPRLHRVR